MKSNLEELIDYRNGKHDYLPSRIYHLFNNIIDVLQDFEKRLIKLEKKPTLEEMAKDFKRQGYGGQQWHTNL